VRKGRGKARVCFEVEKKEKMEMGLDGSRCWKKRRCERAPQQKMFLPKQHRLGCQQLIGQNEASGAGVAD